MAVRDNLPTVSLPLTALYAGAVGALFAILSFRTFWYRLQKGPKAFFGDQNSPTAPKLQGIVRSQANLAEYYAAFFLLFALLEFNKTVSSSVLNGLGIIFLIARVSHAYQLSSPDTRPVPFRGIGFAGTFISLAAASTLNVVYGLQNRY